MKYIENIYAVSTALQQQICIYNLMEQTTGIFLLAVEEYMYLHI
jgi:hypothetical protein